MPIARVASSLPNRPLVGPNNHYLPYQAAVSTGLGRGSAVDAQALAGLKARGYKSIVNLREEDDTDRLNARALGMGHLRLVITDQTAPTTAQMKQFLDFATNPVNQPVYVHCYAGVGRTGVAVACYRMAVQGWSASRALREAEFYQLWVPEQIAFIQQFGRDLTAGRIWGYPLITTV
ncbi:MAG: dual specificity protein phosphatase family protein [Deltaproteobacteria bacterium]|nr:dual specificity protein phosphatase family protein [Deltaproteobacteria bacterium]